MRAVQAVLLLGAVCGGLAFQCYVCNNRPQDDDTEECRERLEECAEGVASCSSVLFEANGKLHTRKFCTAPGTPLYQYLMFFPGSSLCQNINTQNLPETRQGPAAVQPTDAEVDGPQPPSIRPAPPAIRPQQPSIEPQPPAPVQVDDSKAPSARPEPPAPIRAKRQAEAPAAQPHAPAPASDLESNFLCVCTTAKCNGGSYREMLQRLLMPGSALDKKLAPAEDNNQLLV